MQEYLVMPKPRFSAPPQIDDLADFQWRKWFNEIFERVGQGPFPIQGYDVNNLPSASRNGSTSSTNAFSSIIFVYDATAGPTLAFSDGTNWLSTLDNLPVS